MSAARRHRPSPQERRQYREQHNGLSHYEHQRKQREADQKNQPRR